MCYNKFIIGDSMKKFLIILLTIFSLIIPSVFLSACDGNNSNKNDNNSNGGSDNKTANTELSKEIEFGLYPQSEIVDLSLKTSLGEFDKESWIKYNYHIDNEVAEYMWYIDKYYEGDIYRGVYIEQYRPCVSDSTSTSSDMSFQDDNGYYISTVYWFKYEPIKWTVLKREGNKALLLSKNILDSQMFDFSSNNYAESYIRKWLNNDFYNTSFTNIEKEKIQNYAVDNDLTSMLTNENSYACEDTNDKVFLLSIKDVTNIDLGFTADVSATQLRKKEVSDYAKSQGILGSKWALRTPSEYSQGRVYRVDGAGQVRENYDIVEYTCYGVAPVILIEEEQKTQNNSHTHNFNQELLISEASCTRPAQYYRVCECGEKSNLYFFKGTPQGHNFINGFCDVCEESKLEYEIDGKNVSITGIGKYDEEILVIPSLIKGKPVTTIRTKAFYQCSSIKKLIVPESVKTIEESAFAYSTLEDIELPESGIRIKNEAFYKSKYYQDEDNWIVRKTSLDKLQYQILYIGSHLIKGITGNGMYVSPLSYHIKYGTTTIADRAFDGCYFSSLTVGSGILSVGDYAFNNCTLTSFSISKDAVYVGISAFTNNDITYREFCIHFGGTMARWLELTEGKKVVSGYDKVQYSCDDGALGDSFY